MKRVALNLIERILIVGLGSIGKRHLRIARQLAPKADIRVLRHLPNNEVIEHADGSLFNIQEAIKFQPQLAVIANPAPFHIPTAQLLAEIGTHLLIEKPLAISLDGANVLIATCREKNVILSTGYNLRFLPSLQRYRELLNEGMIGKILSVRSEMGQYLPTWRPDSDYIGGVSARSDLGGGVLLELSHEIDYLRWIFGEVYSVQALLTKQSDLQIDVEDSAHLILEFVAKNDNKRPLIAAVSLDFIRQNTTRLCTVIGKLGSLRWNGIIGTVELWSLNSQCWQEIYKEYAFSDSSYIAEWQNFIVCIKEGSKPLVTGEEGLNVLQIIETAILADKIKSQVKVDTINELQEL